MVQDEEKKGTTRMAYEVDPELVHRILLMDPSDFDSLQPKGPTVAFEEFQRTLLHGSDPASAMKRAYHDHVKEKVLATKDLKSLYQLLLELHSSIRLLVPNRPDLHSILQDDRELPDTYAEMLPWIVQAAQALAQLESDARSETTQAWIRVRLTESQQYSQGENSLSFLICSLFYLIHKAELCAQDKQDFYLSQVVAPRLYHSGEGKSIEQQALHERFGISPPITKSWIPSILPENPQEREALRTSPNVRRDLIQMGWINTILFQTQQRQTVIPEIFLLDVPALQSIRKTTKTAAAGCALGWHACRAAKCQTEAVLQDESQGVSLVLELQAMQNRTHASVEAYEQSVEDAVVSLAQGWNDSDSPLDPAVIETLRGQTRSVLRGQDPVLKLLDDRMRQVFADLTVEEEAPVSIPVSMKSGRASSTQQDDSPLVLVARQRFRERGLAFYAKDLAQAAERAIKVAQLAYSLYAEDFLDEMIVDALQ
jgi:hypothetical protein